MLKEQSQQQGRDRELSRRKVSLYPVPSQGRQETWGKVWEPGGSSCKVSCALCRTNPASAACIIAAQQL